MALDSLDRKFELLHSKTVDIQYVKKHDYKAVVFT